ncbi:hypothetical protein LTR36_002002 [Oleoguttula mirabilis]|uniref:Uncharacterized protein n=1 Tax=Oleoguttula mirabilis TaxID=1507867 RepID=A0AAV9JMZ6_9PEZI|nr:hypothetical protein LTR36_002002 [Oleoguttula mirabilis]
MDASPLTKLPPELRNNIFELVVVLYRQILIDVESGEQQITSENQAEIQDAFALVANMQADPCGMLADILRNAFWVDAGALDHVALSPRDPTGRRDDEYHEKAKTRATVLSGWLRSLGPGATHIRSVDIYVGRWCTHSSAASTPKLTAWIIDHFKGMFTAANTSTKLIFEISWSNHQSVVRVEISLPLGDSDQHVVDQDLERAQDYLLASADGEKQRELSKELNACKDDVREMFLALRCLQDPSAEAFAS